MDIQQEAVNLVKNEKTQWETGSVFVTEKIAFEMRNLIRLLRKNYWGIFDKPTDPITGRSKIWIPLTESVCESVIKNIDLDTKDVNFRAKKAEAIELTAIIRNIVKNYLDETNFGEDLDELERYLAIDGTAVWKTQEVEKKTKNNIVDLLNFYIDPSARSIQETPAVIERIVLPISKIKEQKDWINTENLDGLPNIHPIEEAQQSTADRGDTKFVEVFERWGLAPKFIISGNSKDTKLIETRIIVSATGGKWIYHFAEENLKKIKPYEEVWYTRVPNRWYGKGIAEKVMMLQLWLNTIVNIRINRSYISQLGIFKIRKGSGITPQMMSRLAANGAIQVSNMDDLQQLIVQEASQASYKDEDIIQNWAQRVTSAFEVVTGEQLPAATSATATALQSRNAQSQFVLVQEGLGMFLQRWLKRHILPNIAKNVKAEDIIRITGSAEELNEWDKRVAQELANQKIIEIASLGKVLTSETYEVIKNSALSKLRKLGKDRFITLLNKIDFSQYDVQVYITNEEIDKGVLLKNLLNVLQTVVSVPNTGVNPVTLIKQIFDVMGLDINQYELEKQNPLMMLPQPPQQTQQSVSNQLVSNQPIPNQNIQQLVTNANT